MCERNQEYIILKQSICGRGRAVPVDCGDPLCVPCEKMRAEERAKKWFPVIVAMRHPVRLSFTIKDGDNLKERITYLNNCRRKLWNKRLGSRNLKKVIKGSLEFLRSHYQGELIKGNITETERDYKIRFFESSINRFEKKIEGYSKSVQVRKLMGKGVVILDITGGDDWHVHNHAVLDMAYMPWAVIVYLWEQISGASIVEIRELYKGERDKRECFKYVTKPWEIKTIEAAAEFRAAIHGVKRVIPVGGAKPVRIDKTCPICGEAGCHAELLARGAFVQIIKAGDRKIMRALFDDFETGKARTLYFENRRGCGWVEVAPESLYLILRELSSHSGNESPPRGVLQPALIGV